MKDLKTIEPKSGQLGRDLRSFLLILLGGLGMTTLAFVTNPALREELEVVKKEYHKAIAKIAHLEKLIVRKDLAIKDKDCQVDSVKSLQKIIPVLAEIKKPQYVKEPLTARDSARIADIIYEKKPRETISLYDSLVIYNVFKARADKGKIYSVPQQQLHDN
jgi:hypothetical protein